MGHGVLMASMVNCPTQDNWNKLDRAYGYLNANPDYGMLYKYNSSLDVHVYCDAAHLVHNDTRARTGIVAIMCGSHIASMSCKQKLVTKSSTESELIALCDATSWLLYCREFLQGQLREVPMSKVYEDNESTIKLVKKGYPNNIGSKHIKMRYFFIKQHIESCELDLIWCPTKQMIADILTKPLTGGLFRAMRDSIINAV